MNSRLDAGRFTAAEIQTMARAIGLPVDKVRRLTELAVFVAKLPRREARAASASVHSSDELRAWEQQRDDRKRRAAAVDAHRDHDRNGPADEASGYPTCSACGAILTAPDKPSCPIESRAGAGAPRSGGGSSLSTSGDSASEGDVGATPDEPSTVCEAWDAIDSCSGWSVVGVNLLPTPGVSTWRAYAEPERGPVVFRDGPSATAALNALRQAIA